MECMTTLHFECFLHKCGTDPVCIAFKLHRLPLFLPVWISAAHFGALTGLDFNAQL
jgi:hypothetical protein